MDCLRHTDPEQWLKPSQVWPSCVGCWLLGVGCVVCVARPVLSRPCRPRRAPRFCPARGVAAWVIIYAPHCPQCRPHRIMLSSHGLFGGERGGLGATRRCCGRPYDPRRGLDSAQSAVAGPGAGGGTGTGGLGAGPLNTAYQRTGNHGNSSPGRRMTGRPCAVPRMLAMCCVVTLTP